MTALIVLALMLVVPLDAHASAASKQSAETYAAEAFAPQPASRTVAPFDASETLGAYQAATSEHERAAHAPQFIDVPLSSPFAADIAWLADQGITTGYSDGTFRPAAQITRQAFAAFLFRLDGKDDPGSCTAGRAPFPDIPADSQFCSAISWLTDQLITTGYSDGTFRPSAPITRQAMAAFLHRYDHPRTTVTACAADGPFHDVSGSMPFCEAIRWMSSVGPNPITTGYADGSFRPGAVVTRQAMAAFLHRYRLYRPPSVDSVDFQVAAGTNQVRPGDVLDGTTQGGQGLVANTDTDAPADIPWSATVLLRGSATRPQVGGHLVVPAGDNVFPDGLVGRVQAIRANSDGTTSVDLTEAALDEAFSELRVEYAGDLGDGVLSLAGDEPPAYTSGVQEAPTIGGMSARSLAENSGMQLGGGSAPWSGALKCSDPDHKPVHITATALGLTFENVRTTFILDLGGIFRDPYIQMSISAEPVFRSSFEIAGKAECKFATAWQNRNKKIIPVGVNGVTLSIAPELAIEIGGSVALDFEQRTYWMGGFRSNPDGSLHRIRAGSADTAKVNISGEVAVRVRAEMVVQLGYFDRVGVFGKVGPQVDLAVRAEPGRVCAQVQVALKASLGAFLDVWITRWEYKLVDITLPLAPTNPRCSSPAPPPSPPPLTIATSTLPPAVLATEYSTGVVATGGTGPYTWTITGLPVGLAATSNGDISGRVNSTGTYSVTLRVTDANGITRSKLLQLSVSAEGTSNVRFLYVGYRGLHYSTPILGDSGQAEHRYTVGGLPPGLTLDLDGTLHGIPEQAGAWVLDVSVRLGANGPLVGNEQRILVVQETPTEASDYFVGGTLGTIGGPAIYAQESPDGRYVAALTGEPLRVLVYDNQEQVLNEVTRASLPSYLGASALSWSPDGAYLAFTGAGIDVLVGPGVSLGDGNRWGMDHNRYGSDIFLWSAATKEVTRVTGVAPPPFNIQDGYIWYNDVAWSPNGRWLAFNSEYTNSHREVVQLWDSRTNRTTEVPCPNGMSCRISVQTDSATGPWTAHSSGLVMTAGLTPFSRSHVVVWNRQGQTHSYPGTYVSVSPDGSLMAITLTNGQYGEVPTGGQEVQIRDVTTGAVRTVFPNAGTDSWDSRYYTYDVASPWSPDGKHILLQTGATSVGTVSSGAVVEIEPFFPRCRWWRGSIVCQETRLGYGTLQQYSPNGAPKGDPLTVAGRIIGSSESFLYTDTTHLNRLSYGDFKAAGVSFVIPW